MKDDDFFESMSEFLEEFGQEIEEDGQEMVQEYLISHQISLMTGSKLLVNMPAKYKTNVLLAAKQSRYGVYVEDEAFDCFKKDFVPMDGCIGVYTTDINKNHIPFWDTFDAIQKTTFEKFK